LAKTNPTETQTTNNTNPNLTIIYCSETEERNRVDNEKHNP
jgi:hypothetical protein